MHVTFLIGRIAFVTIFLVSGIQKLLDITATGKIVETRFTGPTSLLQLTDQAASMVAMSTPQMLAVAAAIIEIAFALFIIFGLGTRFAAAVLVIYTAVVAAYAYDFASVNAETSMQIMKDVSLIGGLLMLFAIGRATAADEQEYPTQASR